MANIFEKVVGDKCLILGAREGFLRQFDFGEWTRLRIGMFYSFTTLASDNSAPSSETVSRAGVFDQFCLGIKTAGDGLPGEAGTDFIGLFNGTQACRLDATSRDFGPWNGSAFRMERGVAIDGVLDTAVAATASELMTALGSNMATSTNYATFAGIEIEIANRGAATQTATIDYSTSGTELTNVSMANLITQMNTWPTVSESLGSPIDFNDSVVAIDIPDNVFLRVPLFSNRLRVHALRILRIQ